MKVSITGSYPDPRLIKELNSLSNNGYDIDLILWDRGLSFPEDSIKCNIIKFKYGAGHYGNLISIFYMPFWWIFILFWLLKKDQDIIHAANFDTYIFALLVAKIKRKKIIYEMFDFYGDTIMLPFFSSLIGKILKGIDRFFMNFADAIIIADKSRLKQIGKVKKKVIIINNSPKDIVTRKSSEERRNFTVFYGGQVLDQRGIDQIILAIKDIPDINLIIMGYCYSQEYKNKLINISRGMDNVKLILESVPHKQIIDQTLKSDLIIGLYDPKIPNNRYASPNKLFEAMMCGKPIIVNKGTSMVNIINEEKCGITVDYGNIEELKSAMIKLMNDKDLYNNLKLNGRNAYNLKYSWSVMEKRLINIYNTI